MKSSPRKFVSFGVVALAGVGLLAILPADPGATVTPQPDQLPVVRIERTAPAPEARTVRISSVTTPSERATIAFPMPGRVLQRDVGVGDRVSLGQQIAQLDDEPIRHQLRAAEATLREIDVQREQLDRELERAQRLLDAEIGTTQLVERLESDRSRLSAARDAALAQRDEARRMLRETTAFAPVAGVVAQVLVEPGEVVAAGQPVVALLGESAVEIEIGVPERVFVHLAEGDAVEVQLPLSGRTGVPGRVRTVGRATAGPGRLFPVVIDVDDPDVTAGMAADVLLQVPIAPGLAVPVAALVSPHGDQPHVMRVSNDVVEYVPIDVHAIEGSWAIVGGGLSEGDAVVVAGQTTVVAGDTVEVR